ncbi:MAG: helix-turn-helix domain-containing protein [Pseudomonadota bacterium]
MDRSWQHLGERLAAARKAAGMTQTDLATAIDLDRTAVTKIETGKRAVNSLELAAFSRLLKRPISWFVTEPPASVVSRRREREGIEDSADALLETIATDAEQLVGMGLLSPAVPQPTGVVVDSVEAAEKAARIVRTRIGEPRAPLIDLVDVAERLGLLAFVLDVEGNVEGSYVALAKGGIALIQGKLLSGARRFTLVHELGHQVLADEYSSEWVKGGKDERERLVSAFAIHFLLPREGIEARWIELAGEQDAWTAALHLGAEYGASWSALCSHLLNLRLIDQSRFESMVRRTPRGADFMEHGVRLIDEPRSPRIPRSFAAAVVRAYRGHRLGRERTLGLLRGALDASDLPEQHDVPLDGMIGEIESL